MSKSSASTSATSMAKHLKWADVPEEAMTPLLTRQYVSNQHITIARVQLKKGCVVSRHEHHNEQITTVVQGSIILRFPDKEVRVRPGELLVIPPNLPHEAEAPEDCIVVDIFSPCRQDWAEKKDDYMRGVRPH